MDHATSIAACAAPREIQAGTVWINDHIPIFSRDAPWRVQVVRFRQGHVGVFPSGVQPDQACRHRPHRPRPEGVASGDFCASGADRGAPRSTSQSCCVCPCASQQDLWLLVWCPRTVSSCAQSSGPARRTLPVWAHPLEEDLKCEQELAAWPSPLSTSIALVATACGGGGGEPSPERVSPRGQTGGEITIAGCTPENPLDPRQHQRGLRRRHHRRHDLQAGALQHRERRTGERHRRVHRDQRQQDLHGEAQAVQVPGRHRRQGQELRRRLELHRLRPQRPGRQLLLRADRRVRRRAVPRRGLQGRSPRPRPCPA